MDKKTIELLEKLAYWLQYDGKNMLPKEQVKKFIKQNNLALTIPVVVDWVTVESNIPPEMMTDVMVKYKDGRVEVAFFDGDSRFYIEKDDRDVTENIVSWHKLPE